MKVYEVYGEVSFEAQWRIEIPDDADPWGTPTYNISDLILGDRIDITAEDLVLVEDDDE